MIFCIFSAYIIYIFFGLGIDGWEFREFVLVFKVGGRVDIFPIIHALLCSLSCVGLLPEPDTSYGFECM